MANSTKKPSNRKSNARKRGKAAPQTAPKKPVRKREAARLAAQAERKRKFSDELVYTTIREMVAAAGPDGTVRPDDIARAIYPEKWQTLLKRIRLFVHKLAEAGEIEIVRKGVVLDPTEDDVKGIIKLRAPSAEPRITGSGDAAPGAPD